MGAESAWVGRVVVRPSLNESEVAFLKAYADTRHCGDGDPFLLDEHPDDARERDGYDRPAPGAPGLWCPWRPCPQGCCLSVREHVGLEEAAAWLEHLVDGFLRPGARHRSDVRARRHGLTVDHVLDGVVVTERPEDGQVVALEVTANEVSHRVLVPGAAGYEPWGMDGREDELASRRERVRTRRERYAQAVAEDLARGRRRRGQA